MKIEIRDFIAREYQEKIFESCKDKNTLVVLPTGLGKTGISLLLAVYRLNLFPESKVLLCSPTKPLCQQHVQTFKKHSNFSTKDILLLTGAINPDKRKEIWKSPMVIVATPQTIESDIRNNRISLENFSMLCIDEAHRSRLRYANTFVAKNYIKTAKWPRILALTASPGGTKEKIDEICNNLAIETVEIRTHEDLDVKPYIQKKEIKYINVELPEEFKKIKVLIKSVYKEQLNDVKKFGLNKPMINKRDLLNLQNRLRQGVNRGNRASFYGISLVARAIKIGYALELLETQGLGSLKKYWDKLQQEETKAAKSLIKNETTLKAIGLTNELIKNKMEHPKMEKLISLVKDELSNKNSKIIIFANFRNTVDEILSKLNIIGVKAIKLVGQKEGITQKEQIETIKKFEQGDYSCLITTSIGEEGLDIKEVPIAIFYDAVGSEIRSIQRSGRVGRVMPGKVICLLTKDSMDQAYYWSAKRKETTMKKVLYKFKEDKQLSLKDA